MRSRLPRELCIHIHARSAERGSAPTGTRKGSSAVMIVIYREGGVPTVTNESFQREINYAVAKSLLKRMKKQGLMTEEELKQADKKLRAKYAPLVFALVA